MLPTVSVLIPSLDGDSKDLDRLCRAVLESGLDPERTEVITAIGVSPNGRARDVAALRARGEVLVMMDADVSFPDPSHLRDIVQFLKQQPDVGVAGPAQHLPDDLPPKWRQRALQMPRSRTDVAEEFHETDMVTHACMAVRRQEFVSLGMEHPNLIAGTDPDLRDRYRRAGYKVGLVPGTRVDHPPITGWGNLLTKKFRSGRWSRWVRRHYPDYHLSAETDVTDPDQARQTGLFHRLKRQGRLLFKHLGRAEVWGLVARGSYLAGYGWEEFFDGDWVAEVPYPEPPGPETDGWEPFLQAIKDEGEVRTLHWGQELEEGEALLAGDGPA